MEVRRLPMDALPQDGCQAKRTTLAGFSMQTLRLHAMVTICATATVVQVADHAIEVFEMRCSQPAMEYTLGGTRNEGAAVIGLGITIGPLDSSRV